MLLPKLSENQEASLAALRKITTESGVDCASRAAWKKACPQGVSVHTEAMVKTGTVMARKATVSTNGKIIELFNPVEFAASEAEGIS